MTSHEKNHAAGPEPCQPNAVQHLLSDEDIERLQSAAAFDGILLTRSAILEGAGRRDDLPEVIRKELDRLFPQTTVIELVQHLCQQAGLSEILTKVSLSRLQKELFEILCSHLERLRPGDVQTEVLIGWCSQEQASESSFVGVVESTTMDNGGRYGNVPPYAADAKNFEKQSGVVK
ncbi:hypothetical protein NKW84_10150 [Acetobacter senegalensis]|uniref:hypothetical protein n=1 Tax=Acetobacter senegalensis TaxID=446692 RepID=UPI00209E6C18|nr:hypothetical protein [Acetobacter senegalensis]MCP1196219.1 hypothetical protein [Acetobacter senegalensis]